MSVSLHALFRHCVRLYSFLKQVVVTYLCFYTALDSSILENFNERAFDSNRVAPQNLSLFACIFHDVVVCFVFACMPFSIYFDMKCFAIVKCLSWGRFLPVKVTKFSFVLWKIYR